MSRRTSVSGDLDSRNWRVMRRSSSCSSENAKFMAQVLGVPVDPCNRECVRTRTLRSMEIGSRELRQNLATALKRVGAGERLVVTVDGRPVAQLAPLEPAGAPTLVDLAASGLID